MEAIVAGYEAVIAIGRACHPDLRQRGFHPTAAVGVFGSAAAAGKLRGLSADALANALGLAASSAAGLFAFVNGGGDIKRLHAGHAAREGLQAALLAEQGVEGPPDVIEARDGFMQAFAFGRADNARAALASEASGQRGHSKSARAGHSPEPASSARPIAFPPAAPFGITDCYIKPYPCCRHIQPAIEALIGLINDMAIANDEVERIDVATYRIAAEHAETGWDDFASAQLSFPYLMGLALKFRAIKFEHFSEQTRRDPAFAAIARKLSVTAPGATADRGDRLAHRAARRRRPHGEVSRPGRAGARRRAGERPGRAAVVARCDQRRGAAGGVDGEAGVAGTNHNPGPAICCRPRARGDDGGECEAEPINRIASHPYFGNSASALARSICARRASERNPDSWVWIISAMTRGLANG